MSQLNSSNAYSPSRPSSRRWDPGPGQPRLPSAPQREARPGRAFLFCPRRPPAGRGEGKGGGQARPGAPHHHHHHQHQHHARGLRAPRYRGAPRLTASSPPPDSPHSAEYGSAHSPAEAQPPAGPWRCRCSSCWRRDKAGYCSVKASAARTRARARTASGTHSPLTAPAPPAGAIFTGRMRTASASAGDSEGPTHGTGGEEAAAALPPGTWSSAPAPPGRRRWRQKTTTPGMHRDAAPPPPQRGSEAV